MWLWAAGHGLRPWTTDGATGSTPHEVHPLLTVGRLTNVSPPRCAASVGAQSIVTIVSPSPKPEARSLTPAAPQTGIDLGAAREKVRVARALAELPRLSDALQGGAISYAKVRAITRVATPENEGQLLDVALTATAFQVERVVRAWRRCDRVAEARQADRRHLHRGLSTYVDDDGMLVLHGRLTPEQGSVVQRALEAAAEQLWRETRQAAPPQAVIEEVTPGQRRADAMVRLAEAALAGSQDSGPSGDRYQVILHVDAAPDGGRPATPATWDGSRFDLGYIIDVLRGHELLPLPVS